MGFAIHLPCGDVRQVHEQQAIGWPVLGVREGTGRVQRYVRRAAVRMNADLGQLRSGSRHCGCNARQQENTQQLL